MDRKLQALYLAVFLFIPSCAQYEAVRSFAIDEVVEANDTAMDRAYFFLCGNTYRAELAFKRRQNIEPPLFHVFCNRGSRR